MLCASLGLNVLRCVLYAPCVSVCWELVALNREIGIHQYEPWPHVHQWTWFIVTRWGCMETQTEIYVNTDSGSGLLLVGTKPLSEYLLTNHQLGLCGVSFASLGHNVLRCVIYVSWSLSVLNVSYIPYASQCVENEWYSALRPGFTNVSLDLKFISELNSLWLGEAVWRHRQRSMTTLSHIMARCLMATSHCLKKRQYYVCYMPQ